MGLTEMLRAEAEVFFDIDTASGSEQQEQAISASISGDVRTYGVMLNSWVDLGAGTDVGHLWRRRRRHAVRRHQPPNCR